MKFTAWRRILTSLVLLLAFCAPALAQCSMCEGSAAAGSDGGAVYNRSTLFMLSVPYLLLAGVAGYVVHAFRKVRPVQPPGDPVSGHAAGPGSAGESSPAHRG